MSRDASFEDAADQPLRLLAETEEDLKILAALIQDAVGGIGDTAWMRRRRRFALVLNRFRWEDRPDAARAGRPAERVRAALTIDHVLGVRGRGVSARERDIVVNVLDLIFEPGADGGGLLRLILSGDGEIVVEVEALEVTLTDLSRPWAARGVPRHDAGDEA